MRQSDWEPTIGVLHGPFNGCGFKENPLVAPGVGFGSQLATYGYYKKLNTTMVLSGKRAVGGAPGKAASFCHI